MGSPVYSLPQAKAALCTLGALAKMRPGFRTLPLYATHYVWQRANSAYHPEHIFTKVKHGGSIVLW